MREFIDNHSYCLADVINEGELARMKNYNCNGGTNTIRAVDIQENFSIPLNGQEGSAGDYLVEEICGDLTILDKETFEGLFTIVE